MSIKPKHQGFTLIELLMTTVIVGIALLGIASAFTKGTSYLSDMKERSVAAYAVQEQMEIIRSTSFDNILVSFPAGSTTPFTLGADSGFSRLTSPVGSVTVDYPFGASSPNDNIIRVTVTVTWASSGGRIMSKSAATMVTRNGISG
ncbi:MAG: type II secretion system protein [Candidatus Omnitrophica bacterium]|jgi:prepilin-type N-terminal cleavage/methylation domain|nr:type II secretion system protein [Candidatus Omnitrophota bacterium]